MANRHEGAFGVLLARQAGRIWALAGEGIARVRVTYSSAVAGYRLETIRKASPRHPLQQKLGAFQEPVYRFLRVLEECKTVVMVVLLARHH